MELMFPRDYESGSTEKNGTKKAAKNLFEQEDGQECLHKRTKEWILVAMNDPDSNKRARLELLRVFTGAETGA
jgi:hypothetical protein